MHHQRARQHQNHYPQHPTHPFTPSSLRSAKSKKGCIASGARELSAKVAAVIRMRVAAGGAVQLTVGGGERIIIAHWHRWFSVAPCEHPKSVRTQTAGRRGPACGKGGRTARRGNRAAGRLSEQRGGAGGPGTLLARAAQSRAEAGPICGVPRVHPET